MNPHDSASRAAGQNPTAQEQVKEAASNGLRPPEEGCCDNTPAGRSGQIPADPTRQQEPGGASPGRPTQMSEEAKNQQATAGLSRAESGSPRVP